MRLLTRVLYWEAAVWALFGAALAVIPRVALIDLFAQERYDEYAWIRIVGILAIGFALLMVLVAQRVQDHWWWAWAFVATEAGIATIAVLNALFSVSHDSSAVLWWLMGGLNAVFTAGLLLGMARAGAERGEG